MWEQEFYIQFLPMIVLQSKFEFNTFVGFRNRIYSESGRSVPCKFEDYLKTEFHNLMTIRILLCCLLPLDSNISSIGIEDEEFQ